MKSRALFMAGCLFALGIASCGPKTETPSTTDSSAIKPDTTMPVKPADTTPVAIDTTKKDTMVMKSTDSLKHADSVKAGTATGTKKETKPATKTTSSKPAANPDNGTGGAPSDQSKPRRSVMNTNPPDNSNSGTGAVGASKPRR